MRTNSLITSYRARPSRLLVVGLIAGALVACSDATAPAVDLAPEAAPAMAIIATSGAQFISPPPSVRHGALVSNTVVRVFQEHADLELTAAVSVDATQPGTYRGSTLDPSQIPAGTVVNSYLIHQDRTNQDWNHAKITFDEDIIAIIGSARRINPSDAMLGHPGTLYPTNRSARETFEGADEVRISADRRTISVSLFVGAPFIDHLRVLTAGTKDSDGDGVPDDEDAFPHSNLDPTVAIGGCDSGVANQLLSNGATFNDLIGAAAASAKNHGQFMKAVSGLANGWKKDGLISGRDQGAITSCAARSK